MDLSITTFQSGIVPAEAKGYRGVWQSRMIQAMKSGITPMMDNIRSYEEYPNIAARYSVRYELAGNQVRAVIGNTHPAWRFKEVGTTHHWPPRYSGSRLDVWVQHYAWGRGKLDTYMVAKKISMTDYPGNYNFEDHYKMAKSGIEFRIFDANQTFIEDVMAGIIAKSQAAR